MNIPFFTLYGLVGCQHCADAEAFLRVRNISCLIVIANEDIIAEEGIKKVTGNNPGEYPVLVCKIPNQKEIIVGFKKEEYERLANVFYTLASSSTTSLFSGQQQSVPQSTK